MRSTFAASLSLLTLLSATVSPSLHAQASAIRGPAPISVSAANYRTTEKGALIQALNAEATINPPDATATPAEQQVYVFVRGECVEDDLSWDEALRLLEPALAKQGFVNAAAPDGTWIRSPKSIQLLLRVSYGTTKWRDPSVRTDRLTWGDGLIPKPRGRNLQIGGGVVAWDRRAGGNDDFAAQMSQNETAGGIGGAGAATSSSNPTALVDAASSGQATASYESTRQFHLLVVDAFDNAEVQEKGNGAERVWSTFIAAPREARSTFADLMPALAKAGSSYFGQTSTGLQVFNDSRAEVQIGESTVVESDVADPENR